MMNDDTSYQEGWVVGRAQGIALNNDIDYHFREMERVEEYYFLERLRQSSAYDPIKNTGNDMQQYR